MSISFVQSRFNFTLQEIEKLRQKLKTVQADHSKLQALHEDKVRSIRTNLMCYICGCVIFVGDS